MADKEVDSWSVIFLWADQGKSLEAQMDKKSTTIPTNPTPRGRRFLDTKQSAEYVGLSPRTMESYRVNGDGPPYIKHGGARSGLVLYLVDDLDAWLDSRRRQSTSERKEGR